MGEFISGNVNECNVKSMELYIFCWSSHCSKAEMELKRKQEEEGRKKREREEKVMQVWTINKCSSICLAAVVCTLL